MTEYAASTERRLVPRGALRYLGPAFLVSVGYIDPGNWATNIAAGSDFHYDLLWVVLASNAMAIVLQTMAAKLGIVTGRNLAETCRDRLPRPVTLGLWVTTEFAMMATDIAELLGAALGLQILFGFSLPVAALLAAVLVFLVLGLERFGFRAVEIAVIALVGVVGASYLIELILAQPDTSAIAVHLVVPRLTPRSVLVAVGILGATVMPHNLFLHSEVIKTRVAMARERGWSLRETIRLATIDAIVGLNTSFFINAAMLIMAAAVFFERGLSISSIEQAHETLRPLLGPLSGSAFAIALLASGLSSSVTATMAGQVVMGGFLRRDIGLWTRRAITMIPALLVILSGLDTLRVLIVSQVILSLQLPFTVLPLLWFTARRDVMGAQRNRTALTVTACVIVAVILVLNALLVGTFVTDVH